MTFNQPALWQVILIFLIKNNELLNIKYLQNETSSDNTLKALLISVSKIENELQALDDDLKLKSPFSEIGEEQFSSYQRTLFLVSFMTSCIKIIQINFYHSIGASSILCKKLASGDFNLALIQEPWTNRGKILGLSAKGFNTLYDTTCARPRSCITVSSRLKGLLLANYLDGDNVAIKVNFERQGHKDEIILMSAYLPFEEKNPLSDKMRALIEYCNEGNRNLVIGCDANAHHTVWGSTDCNRRGDELLEEILVYNLFLLNQGNEPTFITRNRKEVIDLTVCNNQCISYIKDWRVSNEETLSDHRLINFSITGPMIIKQDYRNPRKTDWGSYIADMEEATSRICGKLSSIADLEIAVDQLQQAILQSFYQNCKNTTTNSPRLVPWWSKEISGLRKRCRKLFNRAKKSGDWDTYKSALTAYNKAIRDSKRNSWKKFCDDIADVSTMARVLKFMAKDRNCGLNTVKLSNGNFSNSGSETLAEMLRVHFPNSRVVTDSTCPINLPTINCGKDKWTIAKKVFTYDRVVWAIMPFKTFKTPGLNGIFPAALQNSNKVLASTICRILSACSIL